MLTRAADTVELVLERRSRDDLSSKLPRDGRDRQNGPEADEDAAVVQCRGADSGSSLPSRDHNTSTATLPFIIPEVF